jgi:hypothetical protein
MLLTLHVANVLLMNLQTGCSVSSGQGCQARQGVGQRGATPLAPLAAARAASGRLRCAWGGTLRRKASRGAHWVRGQTPSHVS